MKVVALTAIGHLELQERNMPVPQAGEVLLKVMASGVVWFGCAKGVSNRHAEFSARTGA